MPASNWGFKHLLHACTKYPNALNKVTLHGFLTAIAIGPEDMEEDRILSTVYGLTVTGRIDNYIELSELVWDAIDEISEDLADDAFEAILNMDTDSQKDPALWMEGFNKAVTLNEKKWDAINEENPEADKKFAFIQSFAGPDAANRALGIPTERYTDYLASALPLFSQAVTFLCFNYRGISDDAPIDSMQSASELSLKDLPTFSSEELIQQSDQELLFNILSHGDMLPREVVDEAIRRGKPVARLLRRHLEDPVSWSEDVDEDDWWGLLHAIFILGYITGEDATQGLLHALMRMNTEQDDNLWDWVSGAWPALFRNKRNGASQQLQSIAFSRNLYWYLRSNALECLLEAAHADGPVVLDEMLQQITRIVTDETEDWDFRLSACQHLLYFPRDAHRKILEQLAEEQEKRELLPHYSKESVDDAYDLMEDRLEWEKFDNPLQFYDPENILSRQIRWAEENEFPMDEDPFFEDLDDLPYLDEPPLPVTYVRETPKIGRNDPCPCGSGKKYKKCCLKKLH